MKVFTQETAFTVEDVLRILSMNAPLWANATVPHPKDYEQSVPIHGIVIVDGLDQEKDQVETVVIFGDEHYKEFLQMMEPIDAPRTTPSVTT